MIILLPLSLSNDITIYSHNKKYVYSSEIHVSQPAAVAYDINHDRIIVADSDNRLLIYSRDGSLLNESEISINKLPKIRLAYDDRNDRIILCDSNSRVIQIFNEDGMLINMFNTLNYNSSIPTSIAYNRDKDTMLIGWFGTSKIHMIDSNGELVGMFPLPYHGREPEFASLRWAETYDIVYDPNNDRIIVVDKRGSTTSVLIFDDVGRLLYIIPPYKYYKPLKVEYDTKRDSILVLVYNIKSDATTGEIVVYDKDGAFSFIAYSGLNGDMHDIAYDPNNDRIILADTRNNKVVILSNSYEIHISPSLLTIMIVPIAISVIIILRFNRVHISLDV